VLGVYVERYLDEAGHRLRLLLGAGAGAERAPTGRLEAQEGAAWQAYVEGFDRLVAYLAEHHPAEYARLTAADQERARGGLGLAAARGARAAPGTLAAKYGQRLEDAVAAHRDDPPRLQPGPREGAFLADAIAVYRDCFDPVALSSELDRLEA